MKRLVFVVLVMFPTVIMLGRHIYNNGRTEWLNRERM